LGIISSQSISISISIGIGIGYDKECITGPERDKELTVGWNCNSGIANIKQPNIRWNLLLRLKESKFYPNLRNLVSPKCWRLAGAGAHTTPHWQVATRARATLLSQSRKIRRGFGIGWVLQTIQNATCNSLSKFLGAEAIF
jgi:hypothetical protein